MKLLHCSVSIRNLLFLFQFVLSNRYIVKRHFHQFRPTCFPACSFFFALLHTHTNNTNSTQLIFFFYNGTYDLVPITAISLQRFNRNDSMKFYHFRFIFFANIFHKLSEDFMSKDMNCSFIYRLSFFFQHRPSILQAFFPSHFGMGKMEWISREREGATHFIANNYILFIFSLFFSFFVHHSSSKTVLQRQFQKWPFRNGTLFYSCIKICGEKNC